MKSQGIIIISTAAHSPLQDNETKNDRRTKTHKNHRHRETGYQYKNNTKTMPTHTHTHTGMQGLGLETTDNHTCYTVTNIQTTALQWAVNRAISVVN